jgi:DNA mismatch repair protein MutL
MGKIKILPSQIANKIAAGEVVDRPAAVVKELIENSIDANATHISLVLEQSGKNLIQVIDNGMGIPEDEVQLAFERHATSKIETAGDLDRIMTLGFRGEALPSIASVSRVEMKSSTQDQELGVLLSLDGGQISKKEKIALKPGTVITIKNLFFNTPARRNFLRSDLTELNHILKVLKRFFLSYPEIEFNVIHNGKELFDLPSSRLDDRIVQVLGKELYEGMVFAHENLDQIELEGYICRPDQARGNSDNQFIFLNKRAIQNRSLNHAVLMGYGNLIERSQYPQFILFLQIPPQLIDINVHPTKMEVRFSNERAIYQLFLSVVRNSIQSEKIVPQFSLGEVEKNWTDLKNHYKNIRSSGLERSQEAPPEQHQLSIGYSSSYQEKALDQDKSETLSPIHNESTEQPRLWQVHQRYICSQVKSGLVIIDQHVAHERILYEKFLGYLNQKKRVPSQKLLFPQTLELALEDYLIYSEIKTWLDEIGFSITDLSGRTVLLESIPADVKVGYEGKILLEIIDYYRENQSSQYSAHEKIAAAFSCKNAIKSGEKLSHTEMVSLIDQLFATKEPFFCPHGRPVIVTLSLDEIDKKFKRL